MEECLSPKQNSGFNKLTAQNAPGGDGFSSTAFGKLPKGQCLLKGASCGCGQAAFFSFGKK